MSSNAHAPLASEQEGGGGFTGEEIKAFRRFQALRDEFRKLWRTPGTPKQTLDKALADMENAQKDLPADVFSCRVEGCGSRLAFDGVEYHWTCPNRAHSELLIPNVEF